MKQCKFDVIVVGAGPAGVTAAGALAGAGMSVALLEAGVYAGAENWSGCVYFAENLAEPDCFGFEAVERAPFERRVERRGTLMHNGLDVVGVELTNREIFKQCYTVLRPVYDPYFTSLARLKGAVHITETTVTSLIRKGKRVIGVQTNRGPLYSDIVFLAEGDASHLVRSERLERVPEPHYFQGVKAVLALGPEHIEKRFGLKPGEGSAYELIVRNALIGGRTVRLNMGGFLYTNRDSLSLGYVLPLDNLKNHYHGPHDILFEWMRRLPYIQELTADAKLSAYGAKIIRSGGWKEHPILVEDGLAVGGASVGLGIDFPFPNFTGPSSATGLCFARAAKTILARGRTPDARNLIKDYLSPLQASVYGRNALYLSAWPKYFSSSSALFGRTVDIACGSAHFLAQGSYHETGRFLRSHLLSVRGLKESTGDFVRLIGALRLWRPVAISLVQPGTVVSWLANLLKKTPVRNGKLKIILHIDGKAVDATALPWPVGSLIERLSPAILQALELVYANNRVPLQEKLEKALRVVLRGLKLTDLIVLPACGVMLSLISLGTAMRDFFLFYVLKTPVEKLLAIPTMAYNASQRKARDLDSIKPSVSLEAKLATNTYRVGQTSHIRTAWPEPITAHPDMARSSLWWVCPARVYGYDAPPLAGRGKVTINFENCIKCESCWRAEPNRTLWGRHTEHRLIYRPESAAVDELLTTLGNIEKPRSGKPTEKIEEKLWYVNDAVLDASRAVLRASASLRDAISNIPASADAGRRAWPGTLGKNLIERLLTLETALSNDGRHLQARIISAERMDLEQKQKEGHLFYALYCCLRLEQRITLWIGPQDSAAHSKSASAETGTNTEPAREEASLIFPDRIVKQWEEQPMPPAWTETLTRFIEDHRDTPCETIRALSSASPALGLIAAHHLSAIGILGQAGIAQGPGICAVTADDLKVVESIESVRIQGTLHLVPLAACTALLVIVKGKGHLVQLVSPGITITPTPAIGFRAAGLSDVSLNCSLRKNEIPSAADTSAPGGLSYLAIALGAADYLSKRVVEHASGRIQFPGQMLDTEGRDGIAKLGAVKAMISRTDAWRLLLETLFQACCRPGVQTATSPESGVLCAAIAAMAFSPEQGSLGYDAGQVFGGFAYSEDDLLSRFYRDSALFRFLPPGHGAAASLHATSSSGTHPVFPSHHGMKNIEDEPLGPLAQRLRELDKKYFSLPGKADPALAGQARALASGISMVLVRIERELRLGKSPEAEGAAAEVLLGLGEDTLHRAEASARRGGVRPTALLPAEPRGMAVKLEEDYETFCTAPGTHHQSGKFLTTLFDRSPRFVPEMQLHDPRLRARWIELADWFKLNCRDRQFDGFSIERHIEKIHGLPEEIIAAAKAFKWLATYIPKSEDGLGWRKAEYYILNSAAGNFGDAGINLLVMASTSIGTTPILLGLENELPRVREELAPLTRNPSKLGEVGLRLSKIIKSFASPNPAWIRKEYETVIKLVDERIRHTRVVKYLGANFLRAFYSAGIAGQRGDFSGFLTNLKHAAELFEHVMPEVRAALEELPRRERCHRLFLRYLGHGGVSAFALTEPTAGSDSGGVKTTAKIASAKLTALPDGRYSFRLDEKEETSVRYLIDADKLLFTEQGLAYQTPEGKAALIKYDRYQYATDQGIRYYDVLGRSCEFHDIGQVRTSGGGPVYEYYILTGAKMWITNGSIATQFCLFAQTPEGVTGFMVDRHSEGLKVGADEKKMGQRGSPTNEISIDGVRVPREAVIGYEGHGQVNALETLNVGRCGLAVVSGALMHKLLDESRLYLSPSPERDSLLGEAAAILFSSESLAFYLIGLFDRPHESVRMESAIAKYACSEDIHELLSLVEQAFGPEGQTEKFLIEKARRDARILTIYEGTNEVQRFLILKDLVAQAPAWPEHAAPTGDEAARTLAEWKNKLRQQVQDAVRLLGDTAWSDAMLQPALFPLAEMAGEILRLECTFFRKEWLEKRADLLGRSDPDYVPALLRAGVRAIERTTARLAHINGKYERARELVRMNLDLAEVRAADAVLDRGAATVVVAPEAVAPLQASLRILCILRPVADLSPSPRLTDGRIAEIAVIIDPLDLAGFVQALALKTWGRGDVTVDALLIGTHEHEQLFRQQAAGADRFIRLNCDHTTSSAIAEAVRTLELLDRYDLITIGAVCLNGDQGSGAYLAGALSRQHSRKRQLAVRDDGLGLKDIMPPAVVSMTESSGPSEGGLSDIVESMAADIVVLQPSDPLSTRIIQRYERPSVATTALKTITTVAGAAAYLGNYAAQARSAQTPMYQGEITRGRIVDDRAVLAILDPREQKANAAVLRGGRQLADIVGKPLAAVVPAARESWPAIMGLARANGANHAYCLDTGNSMLSLEGKRELLRVITRTTGKPIVLAGTHWIDAFGTIAGEVEVVDKHVRFSGNLGAITPVNEKAAMFSSSAYDGRLIRKEMYGTGSAFMTISQEAEFEAAAIQSDFAAAAIEYPLRTEWLMPLPPDAAPTLPHADVIIDVGYGIRDSSGLALAEGLKKKLEAMGLAPLFGATRKVTQDLKLLPLEAQIGQTGVRVNPRLIIAIGISGAPQHIDYIGTRAEILCFNKDPEAPLMKLNETRTSPRVHPITGDLFVTVRELSEKLG